MAIRLASAIGEQREPTSILSGVDDAINKTGDAIQAANIEKRKEEAKKRDAALQAAVNIDTDINALPEDNKRYNQEAKRLVSEVYGLYAKGASPSEIAAKKRDVENTLAPMKNRYEKDFVDFQNIEKFALESENKRDLSEATTFLTGASKAEVPMPSQAPTDRAMPLNKEDSDVTEVVDVQQTPYWELDWKEREKVAPAGVYTEVVKRAKDITGNFNDAIDGYTGGKFDPQGRFTNLQDVLKAGGLDKQQVIIDNEGIAKEKSAFVSSFGSGLGDVKTKQYWNTLTNLAAKRGREAGLAGDRLKSFVEQNVKNVAAQDFDNFVNQEIAKTKIKKIDQDPDREGKGMSINFTGGGGGSNKIWNIGDAVEAPLYEVKDGKKTDKVIGDYYYHSIQTAAAGENPKKFNIAGYTDVQVEGVNVNKKTGKPEYVDITIPARYNKYEKVIKGTGIKKTVRISSDQEIENLKTNLGKDLYKGTIGAHKPEKSAAPKKEVNITFTDYVKAYEKAKGKKATPEVIEKLKIKFQSK